MFRLLNTTMFTYMFFLGCFHSDVLNMKNFICGYTVIISSSGIYPVFILLFLAIILIPITSTVLSFCCDIIVTEITHRFQTARPEVRQLLLQYLLPWLHNMELVDPNVPPGNPLSYFQVIHVFVYYMCRTWIINHCKRKLIN